MIEVEVDLWLLADGDTPEDYRRAGARYLEFADIYEALLTVGFKLDREEPYAYDQTYFYFRGTIDQLRAFDATNPTKVAVYVTCQTEEELAAALQLPSVPDGEVLSEGEAFDETTDEDESTDESDR